MKDFDFPVEYIFPFVLPTKKWQTEYMYCRGRPYVEGNDPRFRDFSYLKYIFRSIEMYAGWFSKIRILIKDEDQIPDWLNVNHKKLLITYHKNFIPAAYRPCFNSNTIEAFLPFLPNVSEFYVYGNDDFLFRNPVKKADFFAPNGEKVKLCYYPKTSRCPKEFDNLCKRCWDTVAYRRVNYQAFKDKPTDTDISFLKQFHGAPAPRLQSVCKDFYAQHENKILKSLTMFRNNLVNLNQYCYSWQLLCTNKSIRQLNTYMGQYFGMDTYKDINKLTEGLRNCKAKCIVINDTAEMNESHYKKIIEVLNTIYPAKSQFEK